VDPTFARILLVAGFGAIGAVSRYGVDTWFAHQFPGQFPIGTFVINVIGSFLLGLLIALTTERLVISPEWRVALGIGALSAFTTFSTYTYDTIRLAENSQWSLAVLYAGGTVALGLAFAVAGLAVGRAV
jgi:fluoride exporter